MFIASKWFSTKIALKPISSSIQPSVKIGESLAPQAVPPISPEWTVGLNPLLQLPRPTHFNTVMKNLAKPHSWKELQALMTRKPTLP